MLLIVTRAHTHTHKHTDTPDLRESVTQAFQDGWPQLGIGFHDFTHKEDDIKSAGNIGVSKEVHQEVHNAAGHIWELEGAVVDGLCVCVCVCVCVGVRTRVCV